MDRVSAPSAPLVHLLQILFQSCSTMASKFISKLAWSRPPSASLSYMIASSTCIIKLARSQPPSASLSSNWSWHPSASPNSLNHSLQMHLCVQHDLGPANASPYSLNHGRQVQLGVQLYLILQVHLQTRSIMACKFEWSWPPSVSRSIIASKSISEFTRTWLLSLSSNSTEQGLQVYLQTSSITASKCITEITRLWPTSQRISKLSRSHTPSASLRSHTNCLQVYLWVHSIIIFRRTSNCLQAQPAASPDIPFVDG